MVDAATARRTAWLGWLVVVGALLIRLYYVNVAVVDSPLRSDAGQYVRIALNVLDHGTFSTGDPRADVVAPDTYRAPGYPALIAVVVKIAGADQAYDAMLLLQCLLGAATTGLTILLARQFMGGTYACVAGLLVAIWPHLVTIGGLLLTETVFGFLLVTASYFFVKGLQSERTSWYFAAGAALGLAALINQVIVGLSIPLVIYMVASRRWSAAVIVVLLALVPPTLWAVRDAHTTSPDRKSGASRLFENVLIGLEPDFVPRYRAGGNEPQAVAARERIDAGLELFDRSHSAAISSVIRRLSDDPWSALKWYLTKPALFWSWSILQGHGDIYVYPTVSSPYERVSALRILCSLCHGLNPVLFVAALYSSCVCLLGRRKAIAGVVVGGMFIFATVIHSALAVDVRYSLPFRPFEMILAAFVFSLIVSAAQRARDARRNVVE